MEAYAVLTSSADSGFQKRIVGERREAAWQMILCCKIGVGAAAHSKYEIPDCNVLVQGASGADADNVVYVIIVKQLISVNSHRRDAHAAALYGNAASLVVSGVSVHASDAVVAAYIFQIVVCDIFCAQRVARH